MPAFFLRTCLACAIVFSSLYSSATAKSLPGSWFKRADANGDGVVTLQEQLDRAERYFNKRDLNGDGRVTEEEALSAKKKWKTDYETQKKSGAH